MASLDDAESGAVKAPVTVRFRISGEPFDFAWSFIRDRCQGTLLDTSAQWALREGHFDPRDPRTVLVEMARDVRAFRVLRHYLETSEMIIPPDSIDRQLLIAEAGFFTMDKAVAILRRSAFAR